jgi:malonyl-CoA decarboxylase
MSEQAQEPVGFLGRTRKAIRKAWRDVVGVARVKMTGVLRPDLPDEDLERLRKQIDLCLAAPGGEASARARAVDLGGAYLDLSDKGRARFLGLLAREYGVDRAALAQAMSAVERAKAPEALEAAERKLRDALVAPRIKFLRQFSSLEQGVKFLVDLRADVLRFAKRDPALALLDRDLRDLLASWFDVGFLDLRRITWDSPAALLERLIDYEAVHEIRSWADLKNRLDSDRRCYAFFHPRMPDEPLIFVEVALVTGMAANIQRLLDESAPAEDPNTADTAIFYSISSAQKGLAGVSFGNFLIKRVGRDLFHDFPNLKVFATLSPLPGFRAWLGRPLKEGQPLLAPAEAESLAGLAGVADGDEALGALLDRPGWPDDAAVAEALEPILMRLAARYLLATRGDSQAFDRVAHFHLSNGARIERLNWLADRSSKGLRQSAGIMVNYRYKLGEIDANSEAYVSQGQIAASSAVRGLL